MSPAELLPMDGTFHIQILYLHWQMYYITFVGRTDVPAWAVWTFFPIAGFIIWLGCTLQVAAALQCPIPFILFGVPVGSWLLVTYTLPKLETMIFGTKGLALFSTILTCGLIAYAGTSILENRFVKAMRRAHVPTP